MPTQKRSSGRQFRTYAVIPALCRDRLFIAKHWPRNESGVTSFGMTAVATLGYLNFLAMDLRRAFILAG